MNINSRIWGICINLSNMENAIDEVELIQNILVKHGLKWKLDKVPAFLFTADCMVVVGFGLIFFKNRRGRVI
jgi:hypothetical protein